MPALFLLRSSRLAAILMLLLWVVPAASLAGASESPPSIVFVIFDEMPTLSLLDPEGRIDAELFPHFASLAGRSVWARNSSTVATRLLESVPALLTGRLPGPERAMSTYAEFPDNLFSWLDDGWELNVREEQSLLAPTALSPDVQEERLVDIRRDNRKPLEQGIVFQQFVIQVGRRDKTQASARPSLDFIHVTLPYAPPRHSANGRVYSPHRMTGNVGGVWSEEEALVEDVWRRHLNEVRYADALLGRLVKALESTGRFDESLIIVTSSYGAGFWPGESRRTASRTTHPEDVLLVPLIVKLPAQKQGRVIDAVVQSIDVLPTIADVLGIEPPWAMDGCSILSEKCERAAGRVSMRLDGSSASRTFDPYPGDLHLRRATLERKRRLFPDVAHLDRSWPAGRFESWRGEPVPTPSGPDSPSAGNWTWNRASKRARNGPRFVAHIELPGALEADPSLRPFVAVEVNGRIEAIARAVPDARGRFVVRAMLPVRLRPSALREMALHLIEGESLRRLEEEEIAKPKRKRRPKKQQQKKKPKLSPVPVQAPAPPELQAP